MISPSSFKCDECNDILQNKFDFLEHQNIHSGETPFMCNNCRQCFGFIREYVYHIKTQNCVLLPVTESVCELKEHLRNSTHSAEYEIKKKKNVNEGEKLNVKVIHNNLEEKGDSSEPSQIVHGLKIHLDKPKNNIKNDKNFDVKSETSLNKYYCCLCQLNFKTLKKYQAHKRVLHKFVCGNCNKKFSTNEKLTKHACFISSAGESFKCSCSQTFTNVTDFKLHTGNKPFSCCTCLMQFNTLTNLIRHIRTHTKHKPFVCKDCGRGFSQSANLKNHSSVHLGVRAIKCNECNFSCKTFSGLIKHKKKHEDGFINHQNYVDGRKKSTNTSSCPICNKQFMFKRNMGMHMKIHNNKASLCNECGKVFESKGKLTSHYKACHREPSVCKTCGKIFASAVLLSAHEKIHVSEKLFSCMTCQKTFSIKNYLAQHMKTHSNKKQFSCSKCGKFFKVAVSLKYHRNICTSLNIPVQKLENNFY